jgi:hypothetical protein
LKPAQANSSKGPYLKKTLHENRAGRVGQSVGLSSSPSTAKKKKKSPHRQDEEKSYSSHMLLSSVKNVN